MLLKKRIEPLKDGPYLVEGFEMLRNRKSGDVEIEPDGTMLCRCGKSRNKPFCDASHAAVGFSDEDAADWKAGRRREYQGEGVTIFSNQRVCAHVGTCLKRLPSVFNFDMDPWVDPLGAGKEEIVETIRACPSGSLSYALADGAREDKYADKDCVSIWKDGPLLVSGNVELVAEQKPEAKDHYTLCRCGESKNKPFCDGSHIHVQFKDEED